MRVVAIAVLLGLIPSLATATTCLGFAGCGAGFKLRDQPNNIQCVPAGQPCTAQQCCLTVVTTKAPVKATTTQKPVAPVQATCVGYTCPNGWTLRASAQNIQCFKSPCSAVDKTTCCLSPTPATAAPPPVKPGPNPCAPVVAGKPAPANPCTTATPPPPPPPPAATCVGFKCAAGTNLRPMANVIKCFKAAGCSAIDQGTCCLSPPPTVPPPVIPGGCKVTMPDGAFQPWEVYKVLKTATTKIDTPGKAVMGGQTLNISNLNMDASSFRCQKVDNEWRAVTKASNSNMATIAMHTALDAANIHTQCFLSSVSMYKSEIGIPGLRFDYDNCPLGPARKATVLIGLRKVPDNFGETPGLANFFKQVCEPTKTQTTQVAQLDFKKIDRSLNQKGCFANTADMTIMHSSRNCFDPALIFTFLDANNHFPVLPVTDSEWDYFVQNLPKMLKAGEKAPPVVAPAVAGPAPAKGPCAPHVQPTTPAPTPAPPVENPCAPVIEPHPHVYSHVIMDRVCISIPELSCRNECGKECAPSEVNTLTTTARPECKTCYDCEWDEVIYAFWGTIITFWLAQTIYRSFESKSYGVPIWAAREEDTPYSPALYSQLNSVRQTENALMKKVHDSVGCRAVFNFGVLSLICSFITYYGIMSWLNYLIVVIWQKKEMCLKVYDYQTNLNPDQDFQTSFHYTFGNLFSTGSLQSHYACFNDVCFWRLIGLVITTWLSIWAMFWYYCWYYMMINTTQHEVVREETEVKVGGGAGAMMAGGGGAMACTVQ